MAKVKSEYGIERYKEETKRLYSVLESRLKDNGECISFYISVTYSDTVPFLISI